MTESFQYHADKLKEYSVKLNYFDKFYRGACAPMHLFQFDVFNKMIDAMANEVGAMKQKTGDYDDGSCTEFVRASKFVSYFQKNAD